MLRNRELSIVFSVDLNSAKPMAYLADLNSELSNRGRSLAWSIHPCHPVLTSAVPSPISLSGLYLASITSSRRYHKQLRIELF